MNNPEFDAVAQLARSSVVWRLGVSFVDALRAAWSSSLIIGIARRTWAPISAWPVERQLLCGALTVAWAGIGYAASLFLLPRYVISGLPLLWVGTLVLGSLVVATFPRAFALAWEAKRGRALLTTPELRA